MAEKAKYDIGTGNGEIERVSPKEDVSMVEKGKARSDSARNRFRKDNLHSCESNIRTYLNSLDEWKDNLKAASLFSSFSRQFEDSPESWGWKYEFWRKVIIHSIGQRWLSNNLSSIRFSPSHAKMCLRRNGISPLEIPHIVKMMILGGDLVKYDDVVSKYGFVRKMYLPRVSYTLGIIFGFGTKVCRYVASGNGSDHECSEIRLSQSELNKEYVAVCIVRKIMENMESCLEGSTCFVDNCLTLNDFKKLMRQSIGPMKIVEPGMYDIEIIVKQMETMPSKFHVVDSRLGSLCIFYKGSADVLKRNKDFDRCIRSISKVKSVIYLIEEKLKILDNNMQEICENIKMNVKGGVSNKEMIRNMLRKRRVFLSNQEGLMKSHANLEQILASIKDSEMNKHVIEAYKTGSSALKNIVSKNTLLLGDWEDTIEDIKDGLNRVKEMNEVLLENIGDNEDLEKELEEIMKEDTKDPGNDLKDLDNLHHQMESLGLSRSASMEKEELHSDMNKV